VCFIGRQEGYQLDPCPYTTLAELVTRRIDG
jgi:hypothetical protein